MDQDDPTEVSHSILTIEFAQGDLKTSTNNGFDAGASKNTQVVEDPNMDCIRVRHIPGCNDGENPPHLKDCWGQQAFILEFILPE